MKTGFTLVETIIYLAILALVSVNLTVFALSITKTGSKTAVGSEVQYNVRTALAVITEQVQKAETINVASSTFGTDPGVLYLEMSEAAINPTVISLDSDDGVLQLTQGTGSTTVVDITAAEVAVTELIFNNLTASSSHHVRNNVHFKMTVEYKDPSSKEYEYTQTVETAVSTRR